MSLLSAIQGPADLKRLRRDQLPQLAQEIRDRLIECCLDDRWSHRCQPRRRRADHRAALRVRFAQGQDRLGRGPPGVRLEAAHRPQRSCSRRCARPAASPASSSAARASTTSSAPVTPAPPCRPRSAWPPRATSRARHHKVVAVVGDGALTCGLSYEGMNNAGHSDRDIMLIVNDNGMSISPNVGAISKTLGAHRRRSPHQPAAREGQAA